MYHTYVYIGCMYVSLTTYLHTYLLAYWLPTPQIQYYALYYLLTYFPKKAFFEGQVRAPFYYFFACRRGLFGLHMCGGGPTTLGVGGETLWRAQWRASRPRNTHTSLESRTSNVVWASVFLGKTHHAQKCSKCCVVIVVDVVFPPF